MKKLKQPFVIYIVMLRESRSMVPAQRSKGRKQRVVGGCTGVIVTRKILVEMGVGKGFHVLRVPLVDYSELVFVLTIICYITIVHESRDII